MNEIWKTATLSEFVKEFIVPQRDKPTTFGGDIPWCRIEDFDGPYLSASKSGKCVTTKSVTEMPLRVFPTNTVLVSCSANLGKCAITTRPLVTNQTFIGLVPKDDVDSKFLYYLMGSKSALLNEMATGVTIRYLSREKFSNLLVSIPSLPEQRRIVRLLDEAFEGIAIAKANAEKNIQNARALFRGYLNSAFIEDNDDWQSKNFEDCIKVVQYTRKVQRKQFLSEGRFPIISQEADFNNGFWNDEADLFEVVRPVVIFGDHTRVLKYVDYSFVLGADGVRILSPHEFLNPKFFYYQLLGTDIRSLGYSRHYRLLKEIKIGFPGLEEQARVVSRIDDIARQSQKLADSYAQKLAALELLRASILGQLLMDKSKAA